jgi:hypothetical protein
MRDKKELKRIRTTKSYRTLYKDKIDHEEISGHKKENREGS